MGFCSGRYTLPWVTRSVQALQTAASAAPLVGTKGCYAAILSNPACLCSCGSLPSPRQAAAANLRKSIDETDGDRKAEGPAANATSPSYACVRVGYLGFMLDREGQPFDLQKVGLAEQAIEVDAQCMGGQLGITTA